MSEPLLIGKAIIRGAVVLKTGMRVGGASGGLKIGGIDLPVIKDAEGVPFIPGSSLKGKLRSLYETAHLPKEKFDSRSGMHSCSPSQYSSCVPCRIWGIAPSQGDYGMPTLTRFVARDAALVRESVEALKDNLELAWTEVKTEINIDRTTGTVSRVGGPRYPERVPAGAKFRAEFLFNIFEEGDKALLKHVFVAMELLEDDYLGGMGSRGYGKVKFENIGVWWNRGADYESGTVTLSDERRINGDMKSASALVQGFDTLKVKLV